MDGATTERLRRALRVEGVVQGVGFRPFVYRLASEENLSGSVGNDTDGVTIEIEGAALSLDRFEQRLRAELPPLARIDAVSARALPVTDERGFTIASSQVLGRVATGIPADAATCGDCLRELLDPTDRRYRYAFLNCTNCGPRYTITRRIPYDRPQTSMAGFGMCAACQREYDDPANRRFHAQPNACAVCGPRLWLCDSAGTEIAVEDAVDAVVARLAAGEIAAIKGIGGFHLAVDATNEAAVVRLRERKRRYGKPLAVMVASLEEARRLCALTLEEERLLLEPARPIVLARMCEGQGIAAAVAPGLPWLGVFLPYAPLQHLLFASGRVRALVMTSANLSEEPIAMDNEEARQRLGGIADVFLMHDREILQRCDDSVCAVVDGRAQLVRRARGYVPLGLELPQEVPPLLAVGGHLKNVFALAKNKKIYQSQHLGDLENLTGLEFFEHALGHLQRTFEIEPAVVAHDLHPGYLSTDWAKRWAAERGLQLVGVQHHHAHVAGCMAEHGLAGKAIGLALDGTGYGLDGAIWGGEVLIAELGEFERFAHLELAAMPGGDSAVREPWRMALGALLAVGVDVQEPYVRELLGASQQEIGLLKRAVERGVNAPRTSSLGRLFDAVAAMALGRRRVDYEAQAAVELEGCCVDTVGFVEGYSFELEIQEPLVIRTGAMWRELLEDLRRGEARATMAAKFHAGVAGAFVQAAMAARERTGITTVAMGGGCLHNRRLVELLRRGLEEEGFAVYAPEKVSPGDGGLSYGQAVVAGAVWRKK